MPKPKKLEAEEHWSRSRKPTTPCTPCNKKEGSMSTRSLVAIEQADGTLQAAHVHHDGYPSGVGASLVACHRTPERAQALVQLGSLDYIFGQEVEKDGNYNPTHHADLANLVEKARREGAEYAYVYGAKGGRFKEFRWQLAWSRDEEDELTQAFNRFAES